MSTGALRARWVVPVDRPPIEGGVVSFQNGRIVDVGTSTKGDTTPTDLGEVALLPGFTNAHTHLEFSDLDRPLGSPGMPFVEWIRNVIAQRGNALHDSLAATKRGVRECLQTGTTLMADIVTTTSQPHDQPQPTRIAFHEVIGFSQARAESALADVHARFDTASRQTDIGISPHAPYTVSTMLLNWLINLACQRRLPVAMHLAESREELQLINYGTGPFRDLLQERSMWDETAIAPGSTPLDYLRQIARSPRTLVIHGNYLRDHELAYLGKHRDTMSLVYCPRTHRHFDHPTYPLVEARKLGARIVLGTDSRASNPDLNLLSEARFVLDEFKQLAPDDVLRMITIDAADALGCGDLHGSITPGKKANFVALPCPDSAAKLWTDAFTSHALTQAVWLGGDLVPIPKPSKRGPGVLG